MKLASWNVNSINVRLSQVLEWLETAAPDILALQETKVTDDKFPVDAFTSQGLHVEFSGQKAYNGVAIISKQPICDIITDIPELVDPQRRIMAATIGDIRLINLYIPNGSEVGSEKYEYKLDWLKKMHDFINQQLEIYPRLAVAGDFNIAPEDVDVYNPVAWKGCVLVSEPERQAFRDLIATGLFDTIRQLNRDAAIYSWWNYRAGGFRRNHGLRIDHILFSEALCKVLIDANVDIEPRRSDRPSDHAPVWATIESK